MRPVAKALILDSESNILALRRSATHPRWPLEIDFPGGDVEEGEKPDEALVREILEETGLKVSVKDLELKASRVNNGRDNLVFGLKLKDTSPKIKVSWEHDSYVWMSSEELLKNDSLTSDTFFEAVLIALRS